MRDGTTKLEDGPRPEFGTEVGSGPSASASHGKPPRERCITPLKHPRSSEFLDVDASEMEAAMYSRG